MKTNNVSEMVQWSETREENIDFRQPFDLPAVCYLFIGGIFASQFAHIPAAWQFLALLPALGYAVWNAHKAIRSVRTLRLRHDELSILKNGRVQVALSRSQIAEVRVTKSLVSPKLHIRLTDRPSPYTIPIASTEKVAVALRMWLPPTAFKSRGFEDLVPGLALIAFCALLRFIESPKVSNLAPLIGCGGVIFAWFLIERVVKDTPKPKDDLTSFDQAARWGLIVPTHSETVRFRYRTVARKTAKQLIRLTLLGLLAIVAFALVAVVVLISNQNRPVFLAGMAGCAALYLLSFRQYWSFGLIAEWDVTLQVKPGDVSLLESGILHPAKLARHWSGLVQLQTDHRKILIQPTLLVPVASDPSEADAIESDASSVRA